MLDSRLIPFEATPNGVGLTVFLRDPDCQDLITNEDKPCTVTHDTSLTQILSHRARLQDDLVISGDACCCHTLTHSNISDLRRVGVTSNVGTLMIQDYSRGEGSRCHENQDR